MRFGQPPNECGYDILGVAPTGSDKTLAYLLPMFERCEANPRSVLLEHHAIPGMIKMD